MVRIYQKVEYQKEHLESVKDSHVLQKLSFISIKLTLIILSLTSMMEVDGRAINALPYFNCTSDSFDF